MTSPNDPYSLLLLCYFPWNHKGLIATFAILPITGITVGRRPLDGSRRRGPAVAVCTSDARDTRPIYEIGSRPPEAQLGAGMFCLLNILRPGICVVVEIAVEPVDLPIQAFDEMLRLGSDCACNGARRSYGQPARQRRSVPKGSQPQCVTDRETTDTFAHHSSVWSAQAPRRLRSAANKLVVWAPRQPGRRYFWMR